MFIPLMALLLGLKHSFDADHLLAVSNFLVKARSTVHAAKIALSWAVGHMLTATIITAALFIFKDAFLSVFLERFELAVAVMLIILGALSLYRMRIFHAHSHTHRESVHSHTHIHLKKNREDHTHRHMFGIGIIHGLASNDELLILITAMLGITTFAGAAVGIAMFSIGVAAGMIAFSTALAYPIIKAHRTVVMEVMNCIIGLTSIAYGTVMIASM